MVRRVTSVNVVRGRPVSVVENYADPDSGSSFVSVSVSHYYGTGLLNQLRRRYVNAGKMKATMKG